MPIMNLRVMQIYIYIYVTIVIGTPDPNKHGGLHI